MYRVLGNLFKCVEGKQILPHCLSLPYIQNIPAGRKHQTSIVPELLYTVELIQMGSGSLLIPCTWLKLSDA